MSELSEYQYTLIHKKLSGEISQREINDFKNWLDESPDNKLLFGRLKDAWENTTYEPRVKGQQSTFKRISRQLDFEEDVTPVTNLPGPTGNSRIWYKIAAAIIVLFTISAIAFFNKEYFNRQEAEPTSVFVEKSNPPGQKTRISLPDGSVCWLNSESSISYLSNFSDTTRDIYLKGEGYFEVAKNLDKPFRVHTPTMSVTALGTIFNLTSFPEDQMETVALVEGKISVECTDGNFPEVIPGEAVQFDRNNQSSSKTEVDTDRFVAWKNGELIFDQDNFNSIKTKLERWYGVNITVVGEPSSELKYAAKFRNELLINVLRSMSYGNDFEYMIDGKNIQIMFNQ